MEKNQFIGLALMLVMITAYFTWFAPEPPKPLPVAESTGVESPVNNEVSNTTTIAEKKAIVYDSASMARYGIFGTALVGDDRDIEIENEEAIFTFGSKGASVKKVLLKNHKTFDGSQVILFDENSGSIQYDLSGFGEDLNTSDLVFNTSAASTSISGSDTLTLTFVATMADGSTIDLSYKVAGTGYEIKQSVGFNGFANGSRPNVLSLTMTNAIKKLEKDIDISRQNSTVKYYTHEGDIEGIAEASKDPEEEKDASKVIWASIKQKFFVTSVIARNDPFEGITLATSVPESDTIIKKASMTLAIPFNSINNQSQDYSFYFGPLKYDGIKDIAPGFDHNIYLGWKIFRTINTYMMIPIFKFLNKVTGSYGLIIFLMVIIIRLLLSPLTFKSHMSMAKMKVLKPEIDAIKEKHGTDQQKIQADQMALYKEFGINPIGGCIPMLLQMPILFAMFNFFPYMSEFRQKAFLWADDLSSYDSILDLGFNLPLYGDHVSLFTLLMTVSTMLTIWSNSSMNTSVQGPMKTMQYIMPVMFLFVLNKYAAALTFYYFVSNVFSFTQQLLFKKFVDEDNIKAKLEVNKKKNAGKKKSKFSQRLEDAMKASAQAQKTKKKK